MGFEHVLSLKIEKIPKKLGYWLVTNYEPETSSLNINGMSLLITKEVIHDVYGVPIGEVPINGFKKSRKRDNVIEEWKRQFVIKNGRIKVSDVIPIMLEDKEGGRKFQLNFLVLFVTVMIKSISNGPVNQKFLANIEGDTFIHNLDWCTYTLDCVNESRKAWNRFGKVIFSPNVQLLDDVEIVEAKNYEVSEKKVDTPITTGKTNDVGDEEMSLEDIVNEVKRNFSVIMNAKALINENIFKGLDMLPNNKDLLTLAKECDVLFGVSLSGNSDDCHFHQDDNANKGNLSDSDVEVPGILT
ncbi:hypothetical protein Tco_0674368 [Tanacetum coccineum]